MKRVAILGPAGAGKSRLARALAEILELPVVHLDRLYWKPNWVPTPDQEWEAIQQREVERESWIADGIQEERVTPLLWLDTADTIVFIDAPPLSCIWRVVRRRRGSRDIPEMPVECEPAPFYRAFPKFLWRQWLYWRKVRPDVLAELARREERRQVAVIRNDEDIQRFLAGAKSHRAALGESLLT